MITLGVFYPSGLTTDNTGKSIVVPASHMMLRTLANNDSVAFPWFAPSGTRRGVVDNATAVGYIDTASGEFETISVTESVRDSMHEVKINPITFFAGAGIVNFGNLTKTSAKFSFGQNKRFKIGSLLENTVRRSWKTIYI